MVYLQNLTKWSCVSFKPKSSESSFISRRYIEQSTIYVTIRVVCLFPSILLSSFLLFILSSFFPSFPLNYLFVSLSSVYSFPSSALPFTFYHIHVQRTCFCLFPLLCPAWHSFTFRGYKWYFSWIIKPCRTCWYSSTSIPGLYKTIKNYDEHNRTKTNRNFGW